MTMRWIIAGFAALLLSGCASLAPPPPLPAAGLGAGAKVGLLVAVEPSATHTHVGTTVFNNFARDVAMPFDLAAHVRDSLTTQLSATGAQVVTIDASAIAPDKAGLLVVARDGAWAVNPEQAAAFKALRETQGLSALVVVYGTRTLVSRECSNMGCTDRNIDKSGLFTRSFLGMTRYFAVPALEVEVVRLDSPADLTRHEPLVSLLDAKVKPMPGMSSPKEFGAITPQEFKPIADAIRAFVDELAKTTARALAGR
jgi:hypothetical protein